MILMIFLTVSIATEPEALGLALIGVLPDRGTTAMIRTVKETWKGAPQRLLWQGLLSCELFSSIARTNTTRPISLIEALFGNYSNIPKTVPSV